MKMMNLLALCLVVTSLAGSAVWSPPPDQQKPQNPNTACIVKEGHRVVVVEYDKNGNTNTKVSISPTPEHGEGEFHDGMTMDEIGGAASVLPNLGEGSSSHESHPAAARELICDAFGKCKHRIAHAMEKVKETISSTAHEDIELKMKEAAHEVGQVVDQAKERIAEKAHDVGECAKETLTKAKDVATTAKDKSKTMRSDTVHKVAAGAKRVTEESKKGLTRLSEFVKKEHHKVVNLMGLNKTPINPLMSIVNLLGFATVYGTCVWVTFVSSFVLSRALPRQQFGMVQSKIYAVYFKAMAYGIGMALVGHAFGQRKRVFTSKPDLLQAVNLLMALLMTCFNSMYLEPKATKVMFERMKMEKEEGRGREDVISETTNAEHCDQMAQPSEESDRGKTGPASGQGGGEQEGSVRTRIMELNERLKKLNSYSSLVNVLTLMSLSWHLVYLSQRLHAPTPD